jgi:TolA-binding protein
MKSLLTIIILSASLFLVGCADDQARAQITDTNIKLYQLEQTVGVLGNKVNNQQILDLLGKIDEMQNQISQLNGAVANLQHDLQTFQDTQNQLNQTFAQQLGLDINKESGATNSNNVVSNSNNKVDLSTNDNNSNIDFQNILKQIKNHNFQSAIDALNSFISNNSIHDNVKKSLALYYIAISYAASGKYKDAIYSARRAIDLNPNSINTPDILFTIYLSQKQLGMKKSALSTAATLKNKYPSSNAAKKITFDK